MPRPGAASTTRRTALTPARWPAARGSPRRVAQRPLPSMMMATCQPGAPAAIRAGSTCRSTLLCIIKSPGKIKRSGEPEAPRAQGACGARRTRLGGTRLGGTGQGGAGRVLHHLLQHLEIIEIAPASLRRDPADGLRPVMVVALLDRDETGFLEHLQVTAEIAGG